MQTNPVVIVTGATTGIGRATAIEFARSGARVVLVARTVAPLHELAAQLVKEGHAALACPADVTLPDTIRQLVERTIEAHGQIDVLVNNAGITAYGPFWEIEPATFDRVMETNFLGAVRCTRAVLPHMIARRAGRIVNISSPAGKRGIPGVSAYSASKFALNGWSEALRVELRPYRIKVVLVLPDQTESELYQRAPVTVSAGGIKDLILRSPRDKADKVARHIFSACRRGQLERYTRWRSRLLIRAQQISPSFVDWVLARLVK